MLRIINIVFILILHNSFVTCSLPSLTVKKLDQQLIKRERQNNLDMCLLFTHASLDKGGRARSKRDTFVQNPALDPASARRVEAIVDRLYDDREAVSYKTKFTKAVTTGAPLVRGSRRFDFAPHFYTETSHVTVVATTVAPHDDNPGFAWHKHWPFGIVPYFIDPKTYDNLLAQQIEDAFDLFERDTCIRLERLRERPADQHSMDKVEWIYISNPSGIRQCVHSNEVKANSGVQLIVFGYDCMGHGEILHEVMHILGFSHEHTRPDRDVNIAINWDNIKPGYRRYFEQRASDPLVAIPYDYESILHYPPRAFSKNGKVTITVKNGADIGQRDRLSATDVQKVTKVFGDECRKRDQDYLLKTCPIVVKSSDPSDSQRVSDSEIDDYFKGRIWPYGVVTIVLRDNIEFSAEERENIRAVIRHIQKETCLILKLEPEDSHETDFVKTEDSKNNLFKNKKVDDTAHFTDIDGDTITTDSTNTPKNNDQDKTQSDSASNSDQNVVPSGSDDANGAPQPPNNDPANPQSQNEVQSADKSKEADKSTESTPANGRRHTPHYVLLSKGTKPGCDCPSPGIKDVVQVVINTECFNTANDLLHVFLHVLGLDHQHNMHDRDQFLNINWNGLPPELKIDMQKKLPPAASVGFPYDYQSVMHYPWLMIKNGVTNYMYPVWNDGWSMGHWEGLSDTDVKKLNRIYRKECAARNKVKQ